MYQREQYSILYERIAEPRRFIQVIAGPRQVGKSTLVKQVLSTLTIPYTLELADGIGEIGGEWISSVWESVRQQMQFRGEKEHLLVIDEIHKIDNWSEIVKREWDSDTFADRNIKVVILGSSRLLLKRGLTESLMGRFELIRMPHWNYRDARCLRMGYQSIHLLWRLSWRSYTHRQRASLAWICDGCHHRTFDREGCNTDLYHI